ncbi:MAG: pyridoxal-phosphate dependent enzyme [Deltaproteobacteria bacterium]|nr:pyridoxal-phosphate dependent enzyme [Deltaproteobacteria bacterium]
MIGETTREILCNAGLTPIPMSEIEELRTPHARIWLKREWTDPEGLDPLRSIKRKPACFLFGDVIEKKYVDSGKLLMSATSGNLGIEIGLLSFEEDFPFFAVVPAAIPEYNLRVLTTLGINVIQTQEQETCPREFTVFFARGYAHEFHHRLVNVEQYYSWLNPLAHSVTTAKEIFEGWDGKVDHVVASVGSCGTICGIRQYLMVSGLEATATGVQPAFQHGVPGTHIIKGDCKWSPENYSPAVLPGDDIHTADSVDTYAFTAKLWQLGIPAGPSTGMALSRAFAMVKEGVKGDIVVLSPDSDFKYTDLIPERLQLLGEEITARHPELELEDAIDDYTRHLENRGGLERMLARVRECYSPPREGRIFGVSDIEDIVLSNTFELSAGI